MSFWIPAITSVVSGIVSSNASSKAADAQSDAAEKAAEAQLTAARESNELQRQQYNNTLQLYQPQWQSGVSNQAALDYVLGTGQIPNSRQFTYPGGIGAIGDGAAVVETINGGTGGTSGGGGGQQFNYLSAGGDPDQHAFTRRTSWKTGNNTGYTGGTSGMSGGSGTYYKVGDKTFSTREEAQQYADGLNAGGGGGTFTPTYKGYIPYKDYFADLSGKYDAGIKALKDMSNFQASPDYNFRRQEGLDAINENAAARGLRMSGDTLKAGAQYASDLADNEYTDYYNRGINVLENRYNRQAGQYYNWLAGLQGQAMTLPTTSGNITQAGQNYATNAGNTLMNAGQAQAQAYTNAGAAKASGYEGTASAFNNTAGNLSTMWMMNELTDGKLWG